MTTLNVLLSIPQTQGLPSWLCAFNLLFVHLVGGFWVFFLSYTAPEFQLWFHFHLFFHVGCPLEFAPEGALEDMGLLQ